MTEPPERRGGRWSRLTGPLVVVLAAASFGSVAVTALVPSSAERDLAAFAPTADLPDPSTTIPGVAIVAGRPSVAEVSTTTPIQCDGVAYTQPVPDAVAAHALAHGAVSIAYDPARTSPRTIAALRDRVTGSPYLLLSPAPGLPTTVTLEAWERQLALDTPDDPRFEQFIRALAANPNLAPEAGGECETEG